MQEHEHHTESDQQQSHSNDISSFVVQVDTISTRRAQDRTTQPPLWNTKEFYFYYLVFAWCLPFMFKTAHEASSEDNPNYEKYKDLLSDGFFGYKVDNSDGQFANFRNNLPTLVLVVCIYIPLSHLFRSILVPSITALKNPQQPLYRAYFFLAFAMVYLYFMYGNSLLKIGAIATMNYAIAKTGRGARWMPIVTWVFNIGIIFLNEGYNGYNFADLHESLAWLDENKGMNGRWDVNFNFTMLRLVSFNMDYYWTFNTRQEIIL
ncbi:glycerol transporter, partial [Modicella reniformis]